MANPSLDDILKEIERDSLNEVSMNDPVTGYIPSAESKSAGMQEVAVHEEHQTQSSPSVMAEDFRADSIPQITRQFLGGGTVMNETSPVPGLPTGLTARQKALPKLSFRMLGSLAAMFVLVIGLGSAVMLSQKPQDIRQYAYDPETRVDPALEPYLNKQAETVETESLPADPTELADETTSEEMPADEALTNEVPDDSQAVSEPVANQAESLPAEVPNTSVWWQNPAWVAGGALILSAILILGVFLHWLFAV